MAGLANETFTSGRDIAFSSDSIYSFHSASANLIIEIELVHVLSPNTNKYWKKVTSLHNRLNQLPGADLTTAGTNSLSLVIASI
jgi:hypothetical protein